MVASRSPSRHWQVPAGYVVHRVGPTWLVLEGQHAEDLVELRLGDPEKREQVFAGAPQRGRGAAPSVALRPGLQMVLRRYRHGGLLGRLTGALYWGPQRALSELRVTAAAESVGAPVPHVMCVVTWPALGPLWSSLIGTREERNARQLLEVLAESKPGAARRALFRAVGDAVRRLHDAGVDHRDLQLRNILVCSDGAPLSEAGPGRIVVVDLDKAVFHRRGALPVHTRASNLGRLVRSVAKNGLWNEAVVGRRDLAVFVHAYLRGDRRLRAALRSRVATERFKLALHRVRYA